MIQLNDSICRGLTIGSGNDDCEVDTGLTSIYCCSGGDTRAPKSALDISEAGGIRAGSCWVESRISFIVDVEGCTERSTIAELLAFGGIITLKRGEAKVSLCVDRCLHVRK